MNVASPISGLSCNVLVLNRLYMAVRVVSARRAFSLLQRQLAEVVSIDDASDGSYMSYDMISWIELSQLKAIYERENHDFVRTVRFEIAVPRIIRLLGYDRLPRQDVKLNRRNIYARDHSTCQYCGKRFPTQDLSLDHVIPRSHGGKTTWENLVCACVYCNAKKGGRTPQQAHMHLLKTPVKPKRNPVINLRLGSNKYASWKHFLDHAYWSVELK
ncbi:MAG: HNH endonuclease [Phycisphaerales bacterium]|nr:HNH endonuclease [Phycisphaerales bacterium]